jgi:transposase-like protein
MTSTLTAPTQLLNSADPRGRRYTVEEKERAFEHWYSCNSLAKTSQTLSISENTLRAWHKEDGWGKRADDLYDDAIEAARVLMARKAGEEVEKNFDTIRAIRDDATQPGKTRLEAAIHLNGVLGIVVPKTSTVNVTGGLGAGRRAEEPPELPDFATMSHDELRAYEEEIRKKRKRQVG